MLSRGKVIAISILAKDVFSDDETFRIALAGYGVSSKKDLTERQGSRLIAQLHQVKGDSKFKGGKRKPAQQNGGQGSYAGHGKRGSQARITFEQGERIGILKNILGWTDNGMYKFVKRQIKRDTGVEMLRNYEASKVIVGMQIVLASNILTDSKVINKMSNTDLINNFSNKLSGKQI